MHRLKINIKIMLATRYTSWVLLPLSDLRCQAGGARPVARGLCAALAVELKNRRRETESGAIVSLTYTVIQTISDGNVAAFGHYIIVSKGQNRGLMDGRGGGCKKNECDSVIFTFFAPIPTQGRKCDAVSGFVPAGHCFN